MPTRLNSILNEPWRCKCPHCYSYAVVRMTSNVRSKNNTFPIGERGKQLAKQDRQKNYRCDSCSERLTQIYDGKDESIVKIDTLLATTQYNG